jgi:hypothetical protein
MGNKQEGSKEEAEGKEAPKEEETVLFSKSKIPDVLDSPKITPCKASMIESERKDSIFSARKMSTSSKKADARVNISRTVMLTGPSNVGKTTIVSQVMDQKFASWHAWTKKQYQRPITSTF